MQQYIYTGKDEKDFYLEFTHNVSSDCTLVKIDDSEVVKPYGVIVVPKDFDTCWIASRQFYLGWKVVIAPVALKYIKKNEDKSQFVSLNIRRT